MGVYVLKQHTPAQLATLQRRVVDTIIAGKPPHGFNMRAFHSQPPKGSELDWFVGRHLDYHMRAADRGDLLTGGPMQRLRRVRLRAEGEVAAAGEGEYFLARESTTSGADGPEYQRLSAVDAANSRFEAHQNELNRRNAGAMTELRRLSTMSESTKRPVDGRAVDERAGFAGVGWADPSKLDASGRIKLTPSEGGRLSTEVDRAAQLNNVRIAAASAAVTGSVLAVDEAAGRVDVLLDTGGVREGVPASDVAAMLSGEDCVAEQDLMWVTFCDSEVRLAAPMRAIGFARTQELGRQLAERGEVLRGASVLKRLMQIEKWRYTHHCVRCACAASALR